MTMTLAMITLDSDDPAPLARWWAERLGGSVVEENDGYFLIVSLPGTDHLMAFQQVPDPTPGKNKMHLDLVAGGSLEAEVTELVAVGATEVARHELGGFAWVTLADPQGNQFCVSEPHSQSSGTDG
ncbi:VOC family protein [Auraticoccus monumenti]|uniref:VOC domain-containing protein n=1 Tax=Auraticoccus monumenti TaxID=675864 RepID=A0A1G6SVX4_9ACTN|nr:VOC family protein [Auraticoccus monumenti]SDD20377.1 hypothetical protein SAMN04489747_0429 [Auraticoccus monumenti]